MLAYLNLVLRIGALACAVALVFCPAPARAGATENLRNGYTCLKLNDLDCALKSLNLAIIGRKDLHPDDLVLAYQLRGEVFQELKSLDAAMGDFDRALALLGKDAMPDESAALYAKKGDLERAKGNLDAALAMYRRSLEFVPERAETLRLRAEIRRIRREFPKALADLNRSIASEPSPRAYYDRSLVQERMGNNRAALNDARKAVELAPNRRAYRSRLGYMENKLKD